MNEPGHQGDANQFRAAIGGKATTRSLRTVQVHLRLSHEDSDFLRFVAQEREQSLSGAVSYLLRSLRASKARAAAKS